MNLVDISKFSISTIESKIRQVNIQAPSKSTIAPTNKEANALFFSYHQIVTSSRHQWISSTKANTNVKDFINPFEKKKKIEAQDVSMESKKVEHTKVQMRRLTMWYKRFNHVYNAMVVYMHIYNVIHVFGLAKPCNAQDPIQGLYNKKEC